MRDGISQRPVAGTSPSFFAYENLPSTASTTRRCDRRHTDFDFMTKRAKTKVQLGGKRISTKREASGQVTSRTLSTPDPKGSSISKPGFAKTCDVTLFTTQSVQGIGSGMSHGSPLNPQMFLFREPSPGKAEVVKADNVVESLSADERRRGSLTTLGKRRCRSDTLPEKRISRFIEMFQDDAKSQMLSKTTTLERDPEPAQIRKPPTAFRSNSWNEVVSPKSSQARLSLTASPSAPDNSVSPTISRPNLSQKHSSPPTFSNDNPHVSIHEFHQPTWPTIPDPKDLSRRLTKSSVWVQRILMCLVIGVLNGICVIAFFKSERHLWVLIFILFVKAKDVVSTIIALLMLSGRKLHNWTTSHEPEPVRSKWILTLITAYNETEDQIMKTLNSARNSDLAPHNQITCVILDGKPKEHVKRRLATTMAEFRRPYFTWEHKVNGVIINCGFLDSSPLIFIEKEENAGKKDSLILGHDLFSVARADAPEYTKLLRKEIWDRIVLFLAADPDFEKFDAIFFVDADSTIEKSAMKRLVEALARDTNAIAACGLLLAETSGCNEWSIWNLFQQFQYTYGELVRRQAEGLWGRVTCLPGCITMIAVRTEMAAAFSEYSKPITDKTFLRHQVQYLGTDRRLTYSMLIQGKHLRTLFVSDAVCETVVPQGVCHYLNQRRRWGSNAYFNDWFYCLGPQQFLITRLWALIDISRMSFVYYRQANNLLFIYGLARNFAVIKIVPLLVVTQIPNAWFFTLVLFRQPILRRRLHKLVTGLLLNYILSPILSILVFTRIIMQLGNSNWGETGKSTAAPDPSLRNPRPRYSLVPKRMSKTFQHGATRMQGQKITLPTEVPTNLTGLEQQRTDVLPRASHFTGTTEVPGLYRIKTPS